MKNNIRFYITLIGLGFVVSSALAQSSSVLPGDASVAATPAWKIYTNANTGLPGNYIYSMAIDAQDNKWIAGDDPIWDEGGLSKFDGVKFTDYTNVDANPPAITLETSSLTPKGMHGWRATSGY